MIEEDRSAVALNIDAKGCRPEVMAKAMARVDAADALAMTPTLEVYDRFAAVRDPVRGEPWFGDVRGDFAGTLLNVKRAEVLPLATMFDFATPWLDDPMVTIAEVTAPQLWIELELRDFLGIGHVRRVTMTSQVIATRTASTEDQAVKHLHNQGTP